MTEFLLGVCGAFLLYVFFRAVEVRWPESYYGISDFTSYQISLHLGRYLAFRFLPVLVVSFTTSVVATSLGSGGIVTGLAVAAIHGLATAGRAMVGAFRHGRLFGRRLLLAAHVGVFALVLIAGWAGGWLGKLDVSGSLVPELPEIRSNLWTALLAGIFGAYLARVTRRSEIEPAELISESMRRIDPQLLSLADEVAARHEAEANLIRALLLVENLQRPRWIRAIERLAGRRLPVGTYGIMQVRSDAPVSDAESIERAVSTKLAGAKVPKSSRGFPDGEALRRQVRSYNGNERFVELVEMVYYELRSNRDR